MEYRYLNKINSPGDLRTLDESELETVCSEIRHYIIQTLAGIGGHFASNLGAVELTVALHYVLNTPVDKLVWDVGHQTYPHKILTGRREALKTVRKFQGLSGFPKREESEYDLYNTGHAGTSISQVLGEACARDLLGLKHKCAAVIGDASIATGMALEAMNHAGHLKTNLLVVLNDNYMSISKNVGSISNYLNSIITSNFYNAWKKYMLKFLKWVPLIGPALESLAKKMERSFKLVMTPGALFEDLGFSYIGPIDGHDVNRIVKLLQKSSNIQGPILMHLITQKGKGYEPAEADPIKYHGVTPFNIPDGKMSAADETKIALSKIVGKTLVELTKKNPKVSVITPAMIEGSGLKEYENQFPDHLFDVGIAEQHAVGFSGAMASGGSVPFLCIYSTFLTRGMDQMTQDVTLMNMPVRIVIDRAGIVGADGETHQGLSDIAFLLSLPNVKILAPSNGQEIIDCLYFMESYSDSATAIRFPKENAELSKLNFLNPNPVALGQAKVLSKGTDITIISVGFALDISLKVKSILESKNLSITLIDLFSIRPFPKEQIDSAISASKKFIIIDENYTNGGVTGFALNQIDHTLLNRFYKSYSLPEEPILHGDRASVLKSYHLDPESIAKDISF